MKRHHFATWFGCIALLGLAGCERAEEADGFFPKAAADGWIAAFNSGDAAGLAMMYLPDAQVLPPGQPIVSGHEAVEAFWQTANPGTVRMEISDVETAKLGRYWFRQGTYTAKDETEGRPEFGKFIELWAEHDNNWLLYRQMWSPNAPEPAQMPGAAPAA
ncbi:MAG: YybH family protein [Steroidobacteraceae bacterium]